MEVKNRFQKTARGPRNKPNLGSPANYGDELDLAITDLLYRPCSDPYLEGLHCLPLQFHTDERVRRPGRSAARVGRSPIDWRHRPRRRGLGRADASIAGGEETGGPHVNVLAKVATTVDRFRRFR